MQDFWICVKLFQKMTFIKIFLKKVLTNGAECDKIIEQKEEELSVLTVSQGEYGMILDLYYPRIMCAVYRRVLSCGEGNSFA